MLSTYDLAWRKMPEIAAPNLLHKYLFMIQKVCFDNTRNAVWGNSIQNKMIQTTLRHV
jgi:hypothetical protein